MVYFIADLHFGHPEIIPFGGRPFGSLDEMEEVLIANWNATVHDDDEVYVLGDFCLDAGRSSDILRELQGTKHLVRGNHDAAFAIGEGATQGFASVSDYREVWHKGTMFVLSHYPLYRWNGMETGAYCLHGHMHHLDDEYLEYAGENRLLCVAAEHVNYTPIGLGEAVKRVEKRLWDHYVRMHN